MHQNINIIIINVIDERARFFDIYKTISISIESAIISIFVFIIKRLNYEFFLERFFQRAVCMNFVNINDEFFKMMLHSLNEKKRINFLNVFVKHVNNKDKKTIFTIKILNV